MYVNNQINVNVNAQASASAMAVAGAQASNTTIVYGGGGGFVSRGTAPAATAIAGLALAGEYEMEEESYTRMVEGWRVVRAVCIDDRGTPHPASRPERDERVREGFEGEIFRCMAGTTLQATLGNRLESGDDIFEGGQVIQCQRGDALRYGRGGEVFCAPQRPCATVTSAPCCAFTGRACASSMCAMRNTTPPCASAAARAAPPLAST